MDNKENVTEEKKYSWGGRRPNQIGRPKGTTNQDGQRKQHQIVFPAQAGVIFVGPNN